MLTDIRQHLKRGNDETDRRYSTVVKQRDTAQELAEMEAKLDDHTFRIEVNISMLLVHLFKFELNLN